MNKKRLALLEKAYIAEIDSALRGNGLPIMQTRSVLAKTMVDEGLLAELNVNLSGVTSEGYELTHAGRMAYCMECD